ncbi:MAG: cytochrome-c oxidase, cbb3-type subunit III [Pseudomonadota bacterium]
MSEKDIDEISGVETTGHEWDGLKELNNPLPRWWIYTFYATIVFSIGYMLYFPAIPLIEGSTMGISGETNRGNLKVELAAVEAGRQAIEARIADTDLETIRTDEELFRYASAGGESLYKVYCSQCHGSGAQGGPGYPNLNDDDWIWGGDLEAIYTTIAHGVRNEESDEARLSEMPAFGDGILSSGEITDVAHYVASLSGSDHEAARAEAGTEIFLDNCAACHGDAGEGIRDLGGPNLADQLWLYGGSLDQIAAQIANPKHGVMPPWSERLGKGSVKQLAVYIHSLGGGEAAPE